MRGLVRCGRVAAVGRLVDRFWDEHDLVSRPAVAGDPPSGVFQAYVPHAIHGFKLLLDTDVWHRARVAERAVALLAASEAVPPADWLLVRAESAASSTIEGIRPSARRLARAEAQLVLGGQQPRHGDREALGNISATRLALEIGSTTRGRTLTLDDVCSVHACLMGDHPEAGRVRSRQSWIGSGISSTPFNAVFVPPPPEALPALLEDLIAAANETPDSPLAQAATVHAQFETIHPFADGNGRTGRALFQLMLRRSGLTETCTPPVSSALALNREAYVSALDSSHPVCAADDPKRSAALAEWIGLCADACIRACDYTQRAISHVEALQQQWQTRLKERGVRSSSAAVRLAGVLPANPVINAASAAELLSVVPRTARRAIDVLADAGILVQRSAGRRNRVYEAEAILDAFVALTRTDGTGLLGPEAPLPQGPR